MVRHYNGVAEGQGPGMPFNPVYCRLMQENTVQIKVWSHARNSGRLDIELLGVPRRQSSGGSVCGLRGGTISTRSN